MSEKINGDINEDNDMFRPLNEEHAAELMRFLTEREDTAIEELKN